MAEDRSRRRVGHFKVAIALVVETRALDRRGGRLDIAIPVLLRETLSGRNGDLVVRGAKEEDRLVELRAGSGNRSAIVAYPALLNIAEGADV